MSCEIEPVKLTESPANEISAAVQIAYKDAIDNIMFYKTSAVDAD